MDELEKLIEFWKVTLEESAGHLSHKILSYIEATIKYLEELKIRKGVK